MCGHSWEGVVNGWEGHSREGVVNGWEGHNREGVVNGWPGKCGQWQGFFQEMRQGGGGFTHEECVGGQVKNIIGRVYKNHLKW